MRTLYIFLTLLTMVLGFTACDETDENDRKKKVTIDEVLLQTSRNVLIEDFTGQRCVNCPLAAQEAALIQQTFGEGRAIVVALHGGSLCVSEDDSPIGLANAQSQALNKIFIPQNESYPQGSIDRSGVYVKFNEWMGLTLKRLLVEPEATISIVSEKYTKATDNEAQPTIHFTIHLQGSTLQAIHTHLHVWLTESHIIAGQIVPYEGFKADYEHNHVFRTALTPLNGEPYTLSKTKSQTRTFSAELKSKWAPENMHIVAFVTRDDTGEVMQAEEIPLKAKEATE